MFIVCSMAPCFRSGKRATVGLFVQFNPVLIDVQEQANYFPVNDN